MRILLDYRPALRQRTGVGEYVHELARALADSSPEDESLLLFSASWKDRVSGRPVPGLEVVDRRIPVRLLNAAWHRLGWPPAEWLARGPLDVAFSAHPLLMPARHAARIVTVHDLHFLDHPEHTRAEIRRDYPALAAAHARRADRVLAVSRHTAAETTRRLGVPSERISICSPGRPDWPRRTDEPADGTVLFLGTLEARKNLGALVDAYARLVASGANPPRLVLAGRQTDESAELVARAGRPPLVGRVEFPGYVEPRDRQALYRQALVLVMPSHLEGFGIPALEAMTCGVPVIAADRGALPEVVGQAGILVNPEEPAAIAAALGQVLGDRGQRDRMREAGWIEAARYTWRDTARTVRDAWRLAIEARDTRRE